MGMSDTRKDSWAGRGGWLGSPNSLAALEKHRRSSPNIRHGMGVRAVLRCELCPVKAECAEFDSSDGAECVHEHAYLEARLQDLRSAEGVAGDGLDEALVQKAALLEVLAARGLRYIASRGGGFKETKQGITAEPAVNTLLSILRTHTDTLNALAQTPAARLKARSDALNPSALAWAEALRGLPAAEVVESRDSEEGGSDGR